MSDLSILKKIDLYLRLEDSGIAETEDKQADQELEKDLIKTGRLFRHFLNRSQRATYRTSTNKKVRVFFVLAAIVTALLVLGSACAWSGFGGRVFQYLRNTFAAPRSHGNIQSRTLPESTTTGLEMKDQPPTPAVVVSESDKDAWLKIQAQVSFKLYWPTYMPPGFALEKLELQTEGVSAIYRNESTGQGLGIGETPNLDAIAGAGTEHGEWGKVVALRTDNNAYLVFRKVAPDYKYSFFYLNWYPHAERAGIGILLTSNFTAWQSIPDALDET